MKEAQRIYGHRDDLNLYGTKEAALKEADALVIVTEWQGFRAPDFDFIKQASNKPVTFDGRNMYESRRGIGYYSVGRSIARWQRTSVKKSVKSGSIHELLLLAISMLAGTVTSWLFSAIILTEVSLSKIFNLGKRQA